MMFLQNTISNTLKIALLCGISLTAAENSWAGKGVWNTRIENDKDDNPVLQHLLLNFLAQKKEEKPVNKVSSTSTSTANKVSPSNKASSTSFNLTETIKGLSETVSNLELAKVRKAEIDPVRERLSRLQKVQGIGMPFDSEEEAIQLVNALEQSNNQEPAKKPLSTKTSPSFETGDVDNEIFERVSELETQINGFLQAGVPEKDLKPLRDEMNLLLESISQSF